MGKAQVAAMIQQHGGIIQGAVQGNTDFLIVGEEPGRKKVEEAIARDTKMVALAMVEQLFEGAISWEEFMQAPSPIITKHSSGFQGGAVGQEEVSSKSYAQALAGSMKETEQASSPTGAEGTNLTTPATGTSHAQGDRSADPPQGDGSPENTADPPSTDKPKANQMEGDPSSTDNLAANQGDDLPSGQKVLFNMPKLQRRLQLPSRGNNSDLGASPSETGSGFVQGTTFTPTPKVTPGRSVILRSHITANKVPQWTTVVNMDICCVGECNIRVAVLELMFNGLKTLAEEDKDVCFLRPDDFTVQAKKPSDLPTKFQRIHERWGAFEEPLDLIRSEVKNNKSKFFRLSIWLGSTMEPKELLGNCVME